MDQQLHKENAKNVGETGTPCSENRQKKYFN